MATTKNTMCIIEGCGRKLNARGYCSAHLQRWRKGQDLYAPIAPRRPRTEERRLQELAARPKRLTVEERFWSKVNKTDGCWEWTGTKNNNGYGQIGIRGKIYQAHRVSYEWAKGPIPAGKVIDHRCYNKGCINPAHLQVATHKQNCENRSGANPNGSSGVLGVHRDRKHWRVSFKHNGVDLYFGSFSSVEEAEKVATRERAKLFPYTAQTPRSG